MKEARYVLADDPGNKMQRLIVLKIDDEAPSGILKAIRYEDVSSALNDRTSLAEKIMAAVGRSLPFGTRASQPSASHSPKLNKLMLILENEDEQKAERAFNVVFLTILTIAGSLIAFDFGLSAWNAAFETSYYAIFDTGTVLLFGTLILAALIYGAFRDIEKLADLIVAQRPTVDELRTFKKLVGEREWESKSMMKSAVRSAVKKITSG